MGGGSNAANGAAAGGNATGSGAGAVPKTHKPTHGTPVDAHRHDNEQQGDDRVGVDLDGSPVAGSNANGTSAGATLLSIIGIGSSRDNSQAEGNRRDSARLPQPSPKGSPKASPNASNGAGGGAAGQQQTGSVGTTSPGAAEGSSKHQYPHHELGVLDIGHGEGGVIPYLQPTYKIKSDVNQIPVRARFPSRSIERTVELLLAHGSHGVAKNTFLKTPWDTAFLHSQQVLPETTVTAITGGGCGILHDPPWESLLAIPEVHWDDVCNELQDATAKERDHHHHHGHGHGLSSLSLGAPSALGRSASTGAQLQQSAFAAGGAGARPPHPSPGSTGGAASAASGGGGSGVPSRSSTPT